MGNVRCVLRDFRENRYKNRRVNLCENSSGLARNFIVFVSPCREQMIFKNFYEFVDKMRNNL